METISSEFMKLGAGSRNANANPQGDSQSSSLHWIPLFSRDWWLEAVAPGQWGVVTIKDNGRLLARWPYIVKKRFGMTLLTMPPLTPRLGPQLYLGRSNYFLRASEEKVLLEQLVAKLPYHDYFSQNFHPEMQNWLPLYWKGFEQTTRYTYILNDISDPDRLLAVFRSNICREIKKAARRLTVDDSASFAEFLAVYQMTFQRQGVVLPFPKHVAIRLDEVCAQQECRKIYLARDENGLVHAGLYLVWDAATAYFLMGGANPALRTSGASSLLLWEAIQFASGVSRQFDFEGSMIEPVERFFRAFGGERTPYSLITHASRRMRVGLALRSILDVCRRR